MNIFIAYPIVALTQTSTPAASALKPLKDSGKANNIIIVNGKKFYSLQNARRFTGSTNSPSALMVIHHPHSPETIITHRSTLAAVSSGGPTAPAAPSTARPSDVLSVFAPDEKLAPAPPPIPAPTK